MSCPSHLQIFNPAQVTAHKTPDFPRFPLLPAELRLEIWRFSLRSRRLIHIYLSNVGLIGHPTVGERYCIVVRASQLLSNKLLQVSRESRNAALEFYRVHLPCELRESRKAATLYLNPEYDILQISQEFLSNGENLLCDFFHRLKTSYDPLHVGLRNMAVELSDVDVSGPYKPRPSALRPEVRKSTIEVLTDLREFYFIYRDKVGRQILGSGHPERPWLFNRSFPIMPETPAIESWSRDPRQISQDLKQVFVGAVDPRAMVHHWYQLLRAFGVPPPRIDYHFIVSSEPYSNRIPPITNRETANTWLQREDWTWRLHPHKPSGLAEEDLEKAVQPAFGFWVFPLDAIGPYPDPDAPGNQRYPYQRNYQMLDLTKYWPILALSSLPK